ncbi:MAG: deoxyguanosinetriphosphate triphosphohydrolase, partial [Nitrospinota bacterium]|nr:deoxyguanosinetriphosphate triphosphohydrolase [Nitrospinota bacterium]
AHTEPAGDDPEGDYRSPYQHDRDRIVHSAAFRRLESKTQVYTSLNQEGDFFRKRLTHTLEVAQISRSIARALQLNEDLTEAAALAHDIGHAPFGHKGQDILHGLMLNDGGFEHNTQTLRIICHIEHRYPDFPGLNLSYELREAVAKKGLEKNPGQDEPLKDEFAGYPNPTLEAQIVDLADPITYCTHDLDDGLQATTITEEMLKGCVFWVEGEKAISGKYTNLSSKIRKYQIIRYIIAELVADLIKTTAGNLQKFSPKGIDDIRNNREKIADFSPEIKGKHQDLKNFLRKNMYDQSGVKRMEHKARVVLESLFNAFLKEPTLFPESVQRHFNEARKIGKEKRIVCDYVAGMTDGFALKTYNDLFPTSL